MVMPSASRHASSPTEQIRKIPKNILALVAGLCLSWKQEASQPGKRGKNEIGITKQSH